MWKGIEQIILKTGVRSQNFCYIFSRMRWQVESCAAAQECHLITKVTCRSLPADYYAARCEHKIEWHRNFLNEISFLADINLPCTSPTHALWACAIGGDRQRLKLYWSFWSKKMQHSRQLNSYRYNEWRNRVSHYGFDHVVKMGLSGRFQQHPASCIGSSSMAPLMGIEIKPLLGHARRMMCTILYVT